MMQSCSNNEVVGLLKLVFKFINHVWNFKGKKMYANWIMFSYGKSINLLNSQNENKNKAD